MITIRFVTCQDAVSAGIRGFEYGFWASHAEALMPDGTLLGAHYDGGVEARPRDYDKGKFTREQFEAIATTPEMAEIFHTFLRAQIGKKYDVMAIAGIVLQRDWQHADRWFCSELMAAALSECGFFPPHLAEEFNHVTPRDLLLILSGRPRLAA
jgi:hypothetical protein